MPPSADPSISASAFFVLRTPSLPFAFQEIWRGEGGDADPETLRERLAEGVRRPGIREALYLASPDLEATLDPWIAGTLPPERARRVTLSVVRYLARMSSRATPFGLFAGCSVGHWGPESHLEVPPLEKQGRRTRLDMDYLGSLLERMDRDPGLREQQTFRPNSSLYRAAGRWRYAESRVDPRGVEHHLVALESTPHLDATLERARGGATLASLAEALAPEAGVSLAEARAFLDQMVEAQVLVSGIRPPLTGTPDLRAWFRKEDAPPCSPPLEEALEALQALDLAGPGIPPSRYRAVAERLAELGAPFEPHHLFQVDLHKPAASITLDPGVRRALEEGAALLRRLTPERAPGLLDRFRQAFRERYEQRWVPLLEALDAEAGIGFGSLPAPGGHAEPLLEDLAFPAGSEAKRTFSPRDAWLLRRLQERGPERIWELGDADLEALENPAPPPAPDAFAAIAILAAKDPGALARGEFQFHMETHTGPSGARILGRFCQEDPELEAQVRAHLAAEEACRPGALFAEIVHQPDGRTGNILARPVLREYEIPFLGVSGAPPERQILLSDLWVGLAGDRIVLRSSRLKREVVPRLSTAHNHGRGLPAYQFLCRLQEQDGAPGGWDWGCLKEAAFLPRVVRGRHVLSRARWRIEGREFEALKDFEAFQAFRAARGLPRRALLEEGDHALWLDLDRPLGLEMLRHLVRARNAFQLVEPFPDPGALVAEGPEGRYCHELVIPFQKNPPPPPPQAPALARPDPGFQRSFPPGSEWLYLKIYTGEATADRILLEFLPAFLDATRSLWDRWFFLRYADPEPHLRLRFHGDPRTLCGELLPRLHLELAPFRGQGLFWKLQLDTYEREEARYGGPAGFPGSETWFWLDSEQVLEQLPGWAGDAGANGRWRWALREVDRLYGLMGLDLPAKAALAARTRQGLAREFQAEGRLTHQLGSRFRMLRQELEALLGGNAEVPGAGADSAFAPSQEACLRALGQGALGTSMESLASSFAHMRVNRMLRSSQRAQEFVIMDFLERIYHSRLKRRP